MEINEEIYVKVFLIEDYKNKDKKFTNLQPIWQLVILNIFTLGFKIEKEGVANEPIK